MIVLNGYRDITQFYESNHSIVYQGIRESDDRSVFIKNLKPELATPHQINRYHEEYKITCQFDLPGIIKAYSLEEYQRTPAIVFEDFGGISLKILMDNPAEAVKLASLRSFLPMAIQITEILSQIHAANVIHKDINPANILLNPQTGQIKIIDFGIATTLTRQNLTLKNVNMLEGTLLYISPEQTGRMNRSLDYRTDFYSLGITFYQILTGKLPFETNDPLELVHYHIAKQPTLPQVINPEIPPILGNILIKLMAKTAESRYQSAYGIKADLELCWQQLQTTGKIELFDIGKADISDKFQISQKLYGRETEVQQLLDAFERVINANLEMMLVVGYSGIGKSALVAEVYKPITKARGYFASGKFDQLQRNIPYSAIAQAFGSLIRQILKENESILQQWRSKLLQALGDNGKVITDVIPELQLIIGEQPEVTELGATESQNRFNLVFSNFLRVFCSATHPLVIFLDDLQWADAGSLKLIQLIMTDFGINNLFLIGAYRDNEVNATHPLTIVLEEIASHNLVINKITLAPLQLDRLSELVADTLHRDLPSVQVLAELIWKKTGGNPFFVNEFLKTLYTENLLTFNWEYRHWEWDINQIEARGLPNEVVDLMIEKLHKLPPSTQQFLRLAACIGAEFDVDTLSIICDRSPRDIDLDLRSAIQAELIIPLDDITAHLSPTQRSGESPFAPTNSPSLLAKGGGGLGLKFAHDRIQQAAYTFIEQTDKKAIHLQIGRLLLEKTPPEMISEKIFKIVDHFDMAIELITASEERQKIANLNLIAGEKAKAATAYFAALQYLHTGRELLAENSWLSDYQFTLKLYEETVEAEYLSSHFDQANELAQVILKEAKNKLDKVKAYELKVQTYIAQNQPEQALETGLEAIAFLGFSLVSDTAMVVHLPELDQLNNLPEMTDVLSLAAMRILMAICPAAYFSRPAILQSIVFTMIDITQQQGYSSLAAYGYIWHAAICGATGQIEIGYQAGQLAMNLIEKYHAKELKAKVINLFCALVRHWKEPERNSIASLQEGIQSGLDTGDNEYACYCIKDYCVHLFFTGENLETVDLKMQQSGELLGKLKQEYSIYQTNTWRQVCLNLLTGDTGSSELAGECFNETEIIPRLLETNNRTLLCVVYLAKFQLAYLFKDYATARKNAIATKEYLDAVMGFIYVAIYNFYESLTILAESNSGQLAQLDQVELNQQKMQEWAFFCPANFQHKYDLVAAELARVFGNYWEAAKLYQKASKGAIEHGFIQEEALACELAAEFYMSQEMLEVAQSYVQKARNRYERWGAKTKVKEMLKIYPKFFKNKAIYTTTTSTNINMTNTSTGNDGNELDLATAIKASQAIACEIMLEQLLPKLMKILIESAGAEKGYLILNIQDQLYIEAEGNVGTDQVTVLQSINIEDSDHLCRSIINYVVRSREIVVLDDAAMEGEFTNDPYIQQQQIKSLLCLPLINQGQLVAIIYLENNLTAQAFTPSRMKILQVLSAQAVVSIENARLYQTLEDKVEQRTNQLALANAEITLLNERLTSENIRLAGELEVTRRLQQMILPKKGELGKIVDLDIAGFMEPANEVGGDYYDVLTYGNTVKIGIGDVTGHGLESGVLMIMTQTAVRTLLESNLTAADQVLDILNRTIYQNVQRMNSDKNLTLALLDYANGVLRLSGQHETIIVVRANCEIELIDTIDLGFPIGLTDEIKDFVNMINIELASGDGVVLYTDGVTEAENLAGVQYGLDRLCQVIQENWHLCADDIKDKAIADVRLHIGEQTVYDDITLVVLKQR